MLRYYISVRVLDDPPTHGDADGLATATTAMTADPPTLGDADVSAHAATARKREKGRGNNKDKWKNIFVVFEKGKLKNRKLETKLG